jgi:chromosome segregation ATPase
MIDGAILGIFPPIVAAVLTYLVANKRARLAHAKLLSDMQSSAIEQITLSEEKMRREIWAELANVKKENESLREEISSQREEIDLLKQKLNASEGLVSTLTSQVGALTSLVNTYKNRIVELEAQPKT